ncbi:hypothetical protein J8273_3561 [Carpediemonas membranifera]|uniref:Uncharacterized protein n=1 Tax=Carpediemonas membranifera TaxID=201153 RepID=A0A8J6AVB7_9EUKA|nr:hypothetical protein J8273_3561 [Carpediemonas membranifera]|eukprot:KAG9393425.1 hypothetical protein J8273_3561 [Carpediemonas membranifera]
METLIADNCGLTDISRMDGCHALFNFSAAHNGLTVLDTLSSFASFGVLNLSHNFIEFDHLLAIHSCQVVSLWLEGTPLASDPHYRILVTLACPLAWALDGIPFTAEERAAAQAIRDGTGVIPAPPLPPLLLSREVKKSRMAAMTEDATPTVRTVFDQMFPASTAARPTSSVMTARYRYLIQSHRIWADQWVAYTRLMNRQPSLPFKWPLTATNTTKAGLATLIVWAATTPLPQRNDSPPTSLVTPSEFHPHLGLLCSALGVDPSLAAAPTPVLLAVAHSFLTALKSHVVPDATGLCQIADPSSDAQLAKFINKGAYDSIMAFLTRGEDLDPIVSDIAFLYLTSIEMEVTRTKDRTAVPLRAFRAQVASGFSKEQQPNPDHVSVLSSTVRGVREAVILSGYWDMFCRGDIPDHPEAAILPAAHIGREVRSAVMKRLSDIASTESDIGSAEDLANLKNRIRMLREPAYRLKLEKEEARVEKERSFAASMQQALDQGGVTDVEQTQTAREASEDARAGVARETVVAGVTVTEGETHAPVSSTSGPAEGSTRKVKVRVKSAEVVTAPAVGHHVVLASGAMGRVVDTIDTVAYVTDIDGEIHVVPLPELVEEISTTSLKPFVVWRHRPSNTPMSTYRPKPKPQGQARQKPPQVEAFSREDSQRTEFGLVSTTVANVSRHVPSARAWTPIKVQRVITLDETLLNPPDEAEQLEKETARLLTTMSVGSLTGKKAFITESSPLTSQIIDAENKALHTTISDAQHERRKILDDIGAVLPEYNPLRTTEMVQQARADAAKGPTVRPPTKWFKNTTLPRNKNTLGAPMLTLSSTVYNNRPVPFALPKRRPPSSYTNAVHAESKFSTLEFEKETLPSVQANVGHVGKIISDRVTVDGVREYYCRWDRQKPLTAKYLWLREEDILPEELDAYTIVT